MRRTHSRPHSGVAFNRHRLVRLSTILVVVFLLLGLAVFVSGVGTYLIPVVVILGVVVGVLGLVGRGGGKDYDDGNASDEWYHRF
jgi:hypothetical protein